MAPVQANYASVASSVKYRRLRWPSQRSADRQMTDDATPGNAPTRPIPSGPQPTNSRHENRGHFNVFNAQKGLERPPHAQLSSTVCWHTTGAAQPLFVGPWPIDSGKRKAPSNHHGRQQDEHDRAYQPPQREHHTG